MKNIVVKYKMLDPFEKEKLGEMLGLILIGIYSTYLNLR